MAREAITAVEKKLTLSWLLAFYGDMLTENQREMARLHWEEDWTLAEIAEQFTVSRQSVYDTLSRTEKQLEAMEQKLGMLNRFQAVENGLRACGEALDRVIPTADTAQYLDAARRWIKALLDQEEE